MRSKARRRYRRPVAWLVALGLVGLVAMLLLRREFAALSLLESAYHAARLFVLEYDLPSFPRSPALVLLMFAAPALAVSALWTAAVRLFRGHPTFRTLLVRDHVVLCGLGRTGRLLARTLRQRGVRVVGIDSSPAGSLDDWSADAGVPVVYGTFCARANLERAGAARARSLVFATRNDLANLEGAVTAFDWLRIEVRRPMQIWTHLHADKLRRAAREAVRASGPVRLRFFDTYRLAATELVTGHFDHATRKPVQEITIIGLGKLGRDVLSVLLADLRPSERFPIRVYDAADRRAMVEELAGRAGRAAQVRFEQADLLELDLRDAKDRAFFLCTGDDLANVTGALMLTRKAGATFVYVVMNRWPVSAIAEHLAEGGDVNFFEVCDLVVRGIRKVPGLFERAAPSGDAPPQSTDVER